MNVSIANTSTPSLAINELELNIESQEAREQRFLKMLSLLFLLPYTIIGVGMLGVFAVSGQVFALILCLVELIGGCVCSISYWCTRQLERVKAGSWLIVIYTNLALVAFSYLFGVQQPFAAGFLSTMFLSLMLLPVWATWFFIILAVVFNSGLYLASLNGYYQPLLHLTEPAVTYVAIGFWILVLMTPVMLGTFLWVQQKRSNYLLLIQTAKLRLALAQIEDKRQMSENVSHRINSITIELNTTASQQASGSQQQASGITELTTFLQDLTHTASAIVDEAELINHTLAEVNNSAQQVKNLAENVLDVGESGARAVKHTIESNQNVNGFYINLTGILDQLQSRSSQIEEVVRLTGDISNETHLLSLNAAIEAAGAGEFGERFGVVASEVKNLAARSLKATKEVASILGQIEDFIKQAAQLADNGRRETQTALDVANESGDVMSKLIVAIRQNAQEIKKIEQAVIRIDLQVKDISHTIVKQHSASYQAVETVQTISSFAQQSASGSLQIVQTTQDLESLSYKLKTALV